MSDNGYVYVLMNPSMDNLVKIGKTERSPEERAKELSRNTGIPNEFVVAYKKHVFNCDTVENLVHKYLKRFRSNERREFFTIPVERAISVIERIARLENSLESWKGQVVDLDNLQLKWHLQADDFVAFFRFSSPLDNKINIVDLWHIKDDGDEVYLTGNHESNSQSLPSNGFLSDEMRLNPGDYVVWCGKERNSALKEKPLINHCIVKITEHSYVSGFCAIPRVTEQGHPIQLTVPGSGADYMYLNFAYQQAKKLGTPRVWAETHC